MEKNFNNDNAQTEVVVFDEMKPYMKENMLNELGEEKYAEIKPDEKFLHITAYDDLKEFLAQLDGQNGHVMTQPVEVNAETATAQLKRRLEKLLDKQLGSNEDIRETFDVDANETIEDSKVTAYIETAGSDYVTQEATIAFDKLAGLTEKELAEKLSQEMRAQQNNDAEFWTDQYFDAETGNFPTHDVTTYNVRRSYS